MIGKTISHYRVLEKIGSGGMGVVYRARDERLQRDVALKVLPEALASDPERMARFKREAQVLASMNHPNVASIYGLEESGGVRALVMELVEGPTLAERIKQGALSMDEALQITKQIAEALEVAHEKGIVHRDLKPANVKVTRDGTVKVLDFGLAKALESQGATTNISDSPTLSNAATQVGVILGTAAYMSPEQARGKALDKRADIWAFGCVLFECLTGRQAFGGDTVSDAVAAILTREPDLEKLPLATPPNIRAVLRRCLQKDTKLRLHDIADARIEIDEARSGTPETGVAHGPSARQNWVRVLPLALGAIILLTLLIGRALHPPSPARSIVRLAVTLPPRDLLLSPVPRPHVALAPDGSRLVYVASRNGSAQLYLRSIDRFESTPITGTEGAESPFFSPDGQSVGFFAGGRLKEVSLSAGAPLTLCTAPANRGGAWGADNTIIFSPSPSSGLFRVSAAAAGSAPKLLTTPDGKQGEISHRWPEVLPGGEAVVFTIFTGAGLESSRIGVLSLKTGEQRVVVSAGAYARYFPSGHLVYARAGGLVAVPFDLRRLEATGHAVSVLEGISISPTFFFADFSSSSDGSLAYVPGTATIPERTLAWVDRKGVAQPLSLAPGGYVMPRLSPDGERLVLGKEGTGAWVYDFARGTLTLLADTGFAFPAPIWTPDGRHVTFRSGGVGGSINLYWIPSDGSGPAERLTTAEDQQFPGSWSPDGRTLAFMQDDPRTGQDIWLLSPEGKREARPYLQTPANESSASFSPDGRWLAYVSDESGRLEIYVRPFAGPGRKWQISTEGGSEPRWARNGHELFYRNGDQMMVAAVETEPTFAPGKPKLLFVGRYEPAPVENLPNYDVSPDGQRFIMIKGSEQAATQVNVVLNWSDELRRLVPAGTH